MNRFLVVDLETTGNNPDKDKIIQVGAVLIEDNQIKDEYNSYVYTDREIPQFIQEMTGISNKMVETAPSIEQVMAELLPLLDNSIFVAHNADFDLGFIQRVLEETGYLPFSGYVLDTLALSRIILPMAESYKLSNITEELEITLDSPHRADEDSKATADLFIQLMKQLKAMPLIYLQRLQEIIKEKNRDLGVIIDQITTLKINNHQQDEQEYLIVNQLALQYPEENIEESKKNTYSFKDLETIFDKDGLLFKGFSNFELREVQKDMANAVWEAFNDSGHLFVEAGTGTGKSLAYLIPGIFWAKEHDEKVVIATHTINLQEQLFTRDIPLLKEILPFNFQAAVLKGRNNYLCLRKFEQQLSQQKSLNLTPDQTTDLAQILTWVALSKTGDAEEINLSLSGRNIWNQIRSDADSCLNRQCHWFRNCFYHRAKNKAQTADLIITNHSLLLTSLKTEHHILPAYDKLVIDEAHQFTEVASRHLGIEITYYQAVSLLQRFYKDARNGFLVKVINVLLSANDPDKTVIADKIKNKIIPNVLRVEENINSYFSLLHDYLNQLTKKQDIGRKVLRITEKIKSNSDFKKVLQISENIYIDLSEWVNEMETVKQLLANVEEDEELYTDFNGILKDLRDFMHQFSEWNSLDNNNKVYWVETGTTSRKISAYLYAVPIEIGPYIKDFLFDKLDSVVLTSATLSVNGAFNFTIGEFGFEEKSEEVRAISLSSPFDYQKQAAVYIPKDFPSIQEVKEDIYIENMVKKIAETAITFNGRTLVLFTSHQMLKRAYGMIKPMLEPFQIKVLGHGIDSNSRSKLTKRFASNSQTILFGTNSFWEGVDVPGEALSALIIARLPFTPPDNPLFEAKSERLKSLGRNPFMELSVPQAVIRFKQGFGRLIRTKNDQGAVIVFDRRIVESRYGKAFINSLPKTNIVYQPFSNIIEHIENRLKVRQNS